MEQGASDVVIDPFADNDELPTKTTTEERTKTVATKNATAAVRNAERGNYGDVTGANSNLPTPAQEGQLMPYTRVADLSDDLRLIPLVEIQNIDLIIWKYNKYHSAENNADFLCLEVSLVDAPEDRFLTNCGGMSAIQKIEGAFEKIEAKLAVGPLIAAFEKIATNNGRSFWVLK